MAGSSETGGTGPGGARPDGGGNLVDACTGEPDVIFCARLAKNCGSVTGVDNCGGPRRVADCGTCTAPMTCGGNGTANLCGMVCVPESDTMFCSRSGRSCGMFTGVDNCGAMRTVTSCGQCSTPQTCGFGGIANVCGPGCTPESDATFCSRLGKNCGGVTANDNCGNGRTVASCGSCTSPQSCGGAGVSNVCGCTPESNATFCSRVGKNCGSVTASDNCGNGRTVASCGSCTSPAICGGGGTTNVCGSSLVHRYRFNGTGTVAIDSVGGANGTIVNAQLGGNGNLVLAGGTTDQYVDLPNGIIRQLTDATFETWVTWNGNAGWERIFDFGDTGRPEGVRDTALSSFYLTPRAMIVSTFSGPEVTLAGFKRADQIPDNELHVLGSQAMAIGTMVHVAVVVDQTNNQMRLYRNGAPDGSTIFADSLSSINDINVWLGRSQYAVNAGFGGTFHEFRIYDSALSPSAIQSSYLAGPDAPSP